MKLENQVCTFEQAKKLKALNVSAESIFYHVYPHMNAGWKILQRGMWDENDEAVELYSAYSTAELGGHLVMDDDTHFTHGGYNEHSGCWELHLSTRDESAEDGFRIIHEARQEAETEAEARADMLIYLLEKNLILAHNLIEG